MSGVERAEITQKEVPIMSDTVPMEIQERLEALEARRLEIISENAVDRSVAEYAVARIAERKAEKSRLKIEARALRMAVDAYAAQAVELVDLGASDLFEMEEGLEIPDVAAGPEEVVVETVMPTSYVTQPKEGAKEPLLKERILRLLREAREPLTRRSIAESTHEHPDRISTELTHMKRSGVVVPAEGQGWTVP